MTQSIEIEFKNLLTKTEYEKIRSYFHLEESIFFEQENHYFDTVNFTLKEMNSALRIRKKGTHYELTLKQPVLEGLLETTQILSKEAATKAIDHNEIPRGSIFDLLMGMNVVPNEIQFFGTLKTKRAEWEFENGLLVLDYCRYLNTDDYELEYEVHNRVNGEASFLKLLNTLEIPIRNTSNKIIRFYIRKYQQLSGNQIKTEE